MTSSTTLLVSKSRAIELPVEVGERLGLKRGDVIVITIEDQRVIVEKRASSPVDASFGLWRDWPPGPAHIDTLREEWDDRLNELLPNQ